MTARLLAVGALVAVVIAVLVVALSSGPSPYVVKLRLADADGLRQGSPVSIAGQDVGSISLGVKNDKVIVTIKVDQKYGPVGRNATASIASVNLLGQKRIQITKGSASDPAPSGYLLPSSQVSTSTDLDQVLDVLTPDVRARLAILINAAGEAMTGREGDFSNTLEQLPPDLNVGTELLSAVANNNNTLGNLVSTSDGFVSELASQHKALLDAIDQVSATADTLASRRAQLGETLAEAPSTLAVLDRFLAELKKTTVPLGPAAQDITDTAPELQDTLAQLNPFRLAADPTLVQATTDAPELSALAKGATPVLEHATPVVGQLADFSEDLQPVSATVNKSVDNVFAILQNWARAIQFRDGLSHVFRGEASITPDLIDGLVNELVDNPVAGSKLAKFEAAELRALRAAAKHPKKDKALLATLQSVIKGTATSGTSHKSTSTSGLSGVTTSISSSLSSLLNYLLKP
jgi:phospholipid/cholesterol/gamma-HCH transport system substrate-binding protein